MGILKSNKETRHSLLLKFLEQHNINHLNLLPLADDCSFRRYFRVRKKNKDLVIMDAPPDKEEVIPFIQMSELLNAYGFSAPKIFDKDVKNGFLLLEDFGDKTYTTALNDLSKEIDLYETAVDVLIEIYKLKDFDHAIRLPSYDQKKLQSEALLFIEWYLEQRLQLDISQQEREHFMEAWIDCFRQNESVKSVLVLRDYHVDNLMVLSERTGVRQCGLLDFQDAVIGPASYDLVSLLQDSRRDINDKTTSLMLDRYLEGIGGLDNRDNFMKSYYTLGTQRALKVFGIFTRQDILYGNSKYLIHIPRLWRYTLANLEFEGLESIRAWINKNVPQTFIDKETKIIENL